MPALYHFEDHSIRVVFIEGKPWLVGEDIGTCLGLKSDDFIALTRSLEDGIDPKDTVVLELRSAEDKPTLARLYSLEMALRFALVAERPVAYRFHKWLEDVLRKASNPLYPACVTKDSPT